MQPPSTPDLILIHIAQLPKARLVALQFPHLLFKTTKNLIHRRAQLVQISEFAGPVGEMARADSCDACLFLVSALILLFVFCFFLVFRERGVGPYLNPGNLMRQEINQEPIRHLAASVLHLL